jgi:cytochrome c
MISAVAAITASAAMAAGNPTKGATVFRRCAACHSVDAGKTSVMGPSLFGVVGRKAGTVPGFAYSPAMTSAGFVWTPAKLDAFIAQPAATVKGTKMPFAGIANAADRADLIAFLRTKK